jgi:hypothetical protein
MIITCAICGLHIDDSNIDPLSVEVRADGAMADKVESQHFFCHASCLEGVLQKDVPFIWASS